MNSKIKICLSLILIVILFCGCANKKEEGGGGGSSDISAQDRAILEKTVPGAYGLDGSDYVYQKGSMQLSRRYSGRNVEFCILDIEGGTIYSLSGIKKDAVKGDMFYTDFTVIKSNNKQKELSSTVKVLAVDGDMLWLKSSKDAYFIVKI